MGQYAVCYAVSPPGGELARKPPQAPQAARLQRASWAGFLSPTTASDTPNNRVGGLGDGGSNQLSAGEPDSYAAVETKGFVGPIEVGLDLHSGSLNALTDWFVTDSILSELRVGRISSRWPPNGQIRGSFLTRFLEDFFWIKDFGRWCFFGVYRC